MNRRFFLIGTAALAVGSIPRPSYALLGVGDLVFCANCSDLATQLTQLADEAETKLQVITQTATQLKQWANQITQAVLLPTQIYSQISGQVNSLIGLTQGVSLLAGQSGAILTRLNQLGSYAGMLTSTPGQISGMVNSWQSVLGAQLKSAANAIGLSETDLKSQAATQQALQAQALTASGANQIAQVGLQLAASNGAVLQQIAAVNTAQAQLIAQQMEVNADRQSAQDQAWMQFLSGAQQPTTGGASLTFQGN
jgi:P-type conjugative transfer protein TrbJ